MTLKEFKINLDAFIEANPGCLDKEVVTAGDDEGNSFHSVHYTPGLGKFDSECGDFATAEMSKANAVCLN